MAIRSRSSCWIGWSIPIQTLAICDWTACLTYVLCCFLKCIWISCTGQTCLNYCIIRLNSCGCFCHTWILPFVHPTTDLGHDKIYRRVTLWTLHFWTRALLFSSSLDLFGILGEWGNESVLSGIALYLILAFFPHSVLLPENIQWHTEPSILVSPNSTKTMGFWKFLTVTRWHGVDFCYFPFAFQRGTFGTACTNNIDRFLHHAMRWRVHHLSHKRSVVFLGRSEQGAITFEREI